MLHPRFLLLPIFCLGAALVLSPLPAWSVDIGGVMPAAMDQPRINILLKTTPNGTPINVLGLDWFMDDPYLDTGASGIMLSQWTTILFDLEKKYSHFPEGSNTEVIYQDIGVGGSQDFNVTVPLYLGIAKYHPDVDGSSTVPFTRTLGPVRLQMTPEDSPEIGPLDVVGMPAMVGKSRGDGSQAGGQPLRFDADLYLRSRHPLQSGRR